jgi:hypothetical protein
LELGRIKGRRFVHKSGRVEHGSAGVGVEMVEARAIGILDDGGVVHPGGHDCGKELRPPICSCDKKSAVLFRAAVSIEGLEGRTEMAKRESRPSRDESRDAVAGQMKSSDANAHRGHPQPQRQSGWRARVSTGRHETPIQAGREEEWRAGLT